MSKATDKHGVAVAAVAVRASAGRMARAPALIPTLIVGDQALLLTVP